MNAKISVFVIGVEAIIYLLSYNLHDRTFKDAKEKKKKKKKSRIKSFISN